MEYVNKDEYQRIDRKIRKDNRYHFCVKLLGSTKEFMIMDFWLYRKDMSWGEYISKENKPILSSKLGDKFEDLKKFVEENC